MKRFWVWLNIGAATLLLGPSPVAAQEGLQLSDPQQLDALFDMEPAAQPLSLAVSDAEAEAPPEAQANGPGEMIRQRFPNGKVHKERWVVEAANGDLVNHGPYVEYNARGEVVLNGNYVMGRRDGTWSKQLSEDQAKQLTNAGLLGFVPPFSSKVTFQDGLIQGDWTCADSRGNLVFIWAFKDGKRNGPSSRFNAKNEVIQSITYVDNLADGPAKVALKRDKSPEDITFEDGRMLRRVDQYYTANSAKPAKNRQRVLKSQTSFLVPTPLNLEGHSWESNSVAYKTYEQSDMLRHGRSITYYPNGQTESEGDYAYGKRTGAFLWWYANGQKKVVGEYKADLAAGVWSWWHENGMREATGKFVEGEKVDVWSVWNADGKLVTRVTPDRPTRVATQPDLLQLH